MVINLRSYVVGGFQVSLCTMRCAHGSIAKILREWDPGPTYLVQRLWDPGGPSYTSRSSVPMDLDKLGRPKSYLDYIHLPELLSLPLPSHCNAKSSSQKPTREVRPYGELQVPT